MNSVTQTSKRLLALWTTLCGLLLLPMSAFAAVGTGQDNQAPEAPLVYRLSIPAPSSHRLHLRISEDHPTETRTDFAIPAWTPGYYQILDYQTDIEHVRATDGNGHALTVTHPSPRIWEVETTPQQGSALNGFVLEYDVNAHDAGLGFFGSVLDSAAQRGYINGASAFLYEVGKTQRPVRLETALPAGWKLATSLNPVADAPATTGELSAQPPTESPNSFVAESYDAFIDCPLQFGQFSTTEFTSDGAKFQCVCVGSSDWDRSKVSAVLRKMVHAEIQVFGAPAFKRYVFFYHVGGKGFEGGLEHHNATVIHISVPLKDGLGEEFQTVTAHEFFHAWNVKRLRPAGLGPFDYTQPVRTASLWWAEGVTDYYSDLLLYRAGLRDQNWLLNDLAGRIDELENNPARLRVTLEDASRKAWEGASEGFDGLSYYLKGSLVGLYFDLRLRELTGGRRSLDDVMRLLDANYGSQNRGYPEDALLSSLEAVAQTDLHDEYATLLRTVHEIPWEKVLAPAGLTLHRDTASYLGVQLHQARGNVKEGLIIDSVETDSAAARSGLRPGDKLLALNGDPVAPDSFGEQIGHFAPRSPIVFTVLRDGERLKINGDSGLRYTHYQLSADPKTATAPLAGRLFEPIPPRGISVSAP